MKKIVLFILIGGIMFCVACFIVQGKEAAAQSGAFSTVIPFPSGAGTVGFFDQTNGKVYIYDKEITTCKRIIQMRELGQAPAELFKEESKQGYEYIDTRED